MLRLRHSAAPPAGAAGARGARERAVAPCRAGIGGGRGRRVRRGNNRCWRGWGYASLNPGSIQADNGAGLTPGIIGLCNKGQPRKLDDWGALRAWAWGASRAIDYFETDPAVDARQIAIEGHSRYGKAAMWRWPMDRGCGLPM